MLSAEVSSPAGALTILRRWQTNTWNDRSLTLETFYLQLHANVLSVFADVIQSGDGCFHMAAVFPIDQ